MSGIDAASCDAAGNYSGPDGNPVSVSRSCMDVAGNTGSDSESFKFDDTNPSVTVALDRAADHNGWYNHAVGYSITAKTDNLSGIDAASCDAAGTYSGPDGNPVSVSRSCMDVAGNTGSDSESFKFDDTNPSVTVALDRAADHNGWYNAAVGYSITAKTDNLSGIDAASCDAAGTYSGPDGNPVSVSRSCMDVAGNTGSDSESFKFDDTNPSVTVALDRAADHNGWYNAAVGYSITAKTDNLSGIDAASCDAAGTYSGPDGNPVSVSRSCMDVAGNTGSDSESFKFDDTNPSVTVALDRAADHNGWYNAAVGYSITAKTDNLSGIDAASCDAAGTYSGPDGNPVSVSRSCMDVAGNTGSDSESFKFDDTNPSVTVALDRAADHNGWYNAAVGYSITAKTDNLSGIDAASCDAAGTYSGPDGNPVSVSRSCMDVAGNTGSDSESFKFDDTNPSVTVALDRAADHNGWYNAAVGYSITAKTDNLSGIDAASCDAAGTYSGPDGNPVSVSRSCMDVAGNTGSDSESFKFDDTNPSVTVALDRAADHNGWYNAAVGYSITAKTDNLSGIDAASCDGAGTYSGPDGNPVSVSRSCMDVAGNTGSDSESFKFDDTNPSVTVALDRAADHNGWYNAAVGYSITAKTDNLSGIDAASCDGAGTYSGPDGNPVSVS